MCLNPNLLFSIVLILTLIDEYSRNCLTLFDDRSIKSDDILYNLSNLLLVNGIPENIRSDIDPEFNAKAVCEWLERIGIKTLFIEPGSAWEMIIMKVLIENFNLTKPRTKLLNGLSPRSKGIRCLLWLMRIFLFRRLCPPTSNNLGQRLDAVIENIIICAKGGNFVRLSSLISIRLTFQTFWCLKRGISRLSQKST